MIEGLARQGRVVHTAVQGRLFVVRTSVGDSSISQHPSIIINAPDDDDDDFPPSMTALRLASPCIVARLLLFKKPVQSSRTRRLTVSFPPSVLNSLPRSRSRNSMTEQARGAGGGAYRSANERRASIYLVRGCRSVEAAVLLTIPAQIDNFEGRDQRHAPGQERGCGGAQLIACYREREALDVSLG